MTMAADYHENMDRSDMTRKHRRDIPVSVQLLSTLLYGGFAIASVAIAFAHFWPAAVLLALVLGWRGGFGPHNFTQASADDIVEQLRNLGPDAQQRRSGNASFDAYREDVLNCLEQEQKRFDNLLGRLREAKDKSEFDKFMDDRANKAQLLD